MSHEKTISAIRFGYGLGPRVNPSGKAQLLQLLRDGKADAKTIAQKYPVLSSQQALTLAKEFRKARRAANDAGRRDDAQVKRLRYEMRRVFGLGLVQGMARVLDSPHPFVERLHWFWADHFTAVPKNQGMRVAAPAYLDEAIRPHVMGRFSDLLKAVVTHPFMLTYLDQAASVGPQSPVGRKSGRGLNENLAREVMELHTLGVGAPYTQTDVRQLAKLMTGLTFRPGKGFFFNADMAEPGAETVLGREYGPRPGLSSIMQVFDDLATHPATARHIARKLAVHFVADEPAPSLVEALRRAFEESGGDLSEVYSALLEHPAAWEEPGAKARQPLDFVAASLNAFGISGQELVNMPERDLGRFLVHPLKIMGQPFMGARGPDGWPEEFGAWITPQGLASRIAWGSMLARARQDMAPDARVFLKQTLADAAGARLERAVSRANRKVDGLVLVLASAEFNRR